MIGCFLGVMVLWILDVTDMLLFRSAWVGRSIWLAAIASILGTSVGVYKDAFTEYARPFEGPGRFRSMADRKAGSAILNWSYLHIVKIQTFIGGIPMLRISR